MSRLVSRTEPGAQDIKFADLLETNQPPHIDLVPPVSEQ